MSRSSNNINTSLGGGGADVSLQDTLVINSDQASVDSGYLYKHDNQYDGFIRKLSDGEMYLVKNENDNSNITFSNLGTLNANTIKCDNIYSTQSTTINSINLVDNSIIMNKNSTSDVNDTGIYFQHANNLFTGLVRDQSKEFNFVNLSALPSNTTTTFNNTQLTDVKLRDLKVNQNLKILNSNGYTNTINTNSTQSTNLTLTLPISAGSNGDVLVTNGSGQLNWNSSITSDITSLQNRVQDESVEVGKFAGQNNHSTYGIAIGSEAGRHSQQENAIAIGVQAGHLVQGIGSISIGYLAGYSALGISTNAIAIGYQAGQISQSFNCVAIGLQAGQTNQGARAIAIGRGAGAENQGDTAIAIGRDAGATAQGLYAVSLGYACGASNQGTYATAIGQNSGQYTQGQYAVAIGRNSGTDNQGSSSIAIGDNAGYSYQSYNSIAIGNEAGQYTQSFRSIAIGRATGRYGQGLDSVAIGRDAGGANQSSQSVAIGNQTGRYGQGMNAVAIGNNAGNNNQSASTVAIGDSAGLDSQGQYSVAIGYNAGRTNQSSQSIAINASTTDLVANQQGCFINPVRNVNSNQNIITYNSSSKEMTYDSALYSSIINKYITSDYFYLYPPTSSYRVMSLQPSLFNDNVGGFKKNFYTVAVNSTITDILIESVGENLPVKYDIRITKQSGATTTQTTDTITMSSALTNPSGIDNFASVSYYNTLPAYESYLVHNYPFSYNTINVADTTNFRSLIGSTAFTNEQVKVGIASHEFTPFNSLTTYNLINFNGSGSTNSPTVVNANGYTLITFWFFVKHNFLANNIRALLLTNKGIGTGTQFQNRNFDIFLKNTSNSGISAEAGFSYQVEVDLKYDWTSTATSSETLNSGARQLANDTWAHFAIYMTPQRFIVYVNGQTWIYSNQRNYAWDNSYLTLGNYYYANSDNWVAINGFMNDLRVYNSSGTDFLSDWSSYSTLGTTYPKINDYFSNSNITTSSNAVGNSNFISLASPISVSKGDRIYLEVKENIANTSNFDELVSTKLLLKIT